MPVEAIDYNVVGSLCKEKADQELQPLTLTTRCRTSIEFPQIMSESLKHARLDRQYTIASSENTSKMLKNYISIHENLLEHLVSRFKIIGENLDLQQA